MSYQTEEQILLDILQEEVADDIESSRGRMDVLLEGGDVESWEIERRYFYSLQNKLSKIEWLVEFESDSISSHQTTVKIISNTGHQREFLAKEKYLNVVLLEEEGVK